MKHAYIDCNILLDFLLQREPYAYAAGKLIELTEQQRVKSYLSPLTLATTHYLLSRYANKKLADTFVSDASRVFQFVDMTALSTEQAITHRYKDFEDDLHYYTALAGSMDYLVTRNKKDFKNKGLQLVTAEELILVIEQQDT